MGSIVLEHSNILDILPDREAAAHKGCFGRVLLLCGSVGYTGAAALAAMGALRTGAGLVYLGVPRSVYPILAAKLTEPIVFPVSDKDGMFGPDAYDQIADRLSAMDAVLIGPGMGVSAHTENLTIDIIRRYNGPLIIDADGINVLSGHTDLLRRRSAPTILTPHLKEFERLGGKRGEDRVYMARSLSEMLNSIVLLKGHNTVITDAETVYLNPTGNPGMAVGGSGDVLSGIILSLVGQGLKPLLAAAVGAWLHGKAGDLVAEQIGQYGLLPSDMLEVLPRLLK